MITPAIVRFLIKLMVLGGLLLGLPLIGVLLAGHNVALYFEFPPQTRHIEHAPFSWIAFAIIALFILAMILPLIIKGRQGYQNTPPKIRASTALPLPWWGWLGITMGVLAWILAWTRFSWFTAIQPHTFSPLWFSYILVVNAVCFRRTGHCLMTDQPKFFLSLFPASAAFWWFFEYLNRYTQNWYYVGAEFGPWAYFWYATLPFSTVLPAVLSTRQWLLTSSWIRRAFGDFTRLKIPRIGLVAVCGLLLSAGGLAAIGVWPNYFFPFLWISPFVVIICLQTLMEDDHIFAQLSAGDWSAVVAAALAALVCGGFWEMWNFYSLAKWQYSIPLVDRYKIFEMPLLGYAGYLPFGLECAAIGAMLEKLANAPIKTNMLSTKRK
ncbi:MAG: hypothetical protein KJO34_04560 [Deltaproteobacteria bacterium]|nr:hypothetical protein [Deltaproteobacteria bacterium]